MTGVVKTYTIIHVAPEELAPLPYAVVVVDTEDGGRLAARADGDLSWLSALGSWLSSTRDSGSTADPKGPPRVSPLREQTEPLRVRGLGARRAGRHVDVDRSRPGAAARLDAFAGYA